MPGKQTPGAVIGDLYPLTLDEPEACAECGAGDRELSDYPTLAGAIRICDGCRAELAELNGDE